MNLKFLGSKDIRSFLELIFLIDSFISEIEISYLESLGKTNNLYILVKSSILDLMFRPIYLFLFDMSSLYDLGLVCYFLRNSVQIRVYEPESSSTDALMFQYPRDFSTCRTKILLFPFSITPLIDYENYFPFMQRL